MSACECGKIRYLSRKNARQDARRFQGIPAGKLRAYQCGGGFWHLTSEPTWKTTFYRDLRTGGL